MAVLTECAQTGTAEADLEMMDKLGMDTGLKAVHPITGEAVWVANFENLTGLAKPVRFGLFDALKAEQLSNDDRALRRQVHEMIKI